MNNEIKLNWYKYVVKRYLCDLLECMEKSTTEIERRYYLDRYDVSLSIFAGELGVRPSILSRYINIFRETSRKLQERA